MRSLVTIRLAAAARAGCRPVHRAADPAVLDPVARRYVELVLGLGKHDPNYVDAYYGPDSLKTIAEASALGVEQIKLAAESLLAALGDSVPVYADSMVGFWHRYLQRQLASMVARARMLGGEQMSFDQEARALYDADPPHFSDAHFDSLLARLDSVLPGPGPLAGRY